MGAGRLLVAVYALFGVAATSRAVYQIVTRFDVAPVAYVLSACAAVVYVVATVALAKRSRAARWVASAAVTIELVGVLVIGTITATGAVNFPDDTVWSMYGRGYLFIPLVLPIAGLLWLRHISASPARGSGRDSSAGRG
ncbi:hypothetical protein EF847_00775 [Actinobacteria bacterium YIM 96077]|uniref:Integral membrane protein n=1 Tax=Phytoactinopolyspora halophila TaxID=1981511 RepID=A0A329R0C2_9ACTN|nr:hypothetical protein EF847_00775 [Actinobacteria bacterium YIM 96077]RAW18045.1 hypothetical protein DPM12_04230 [Phytoactinopolyspora halophila]